jgi:hypothetical protein
MLVPLGRLAPATVEQRDRRADLGDGGSHGIVKRSNKRLQRLPRMVARPQSKRAKVACQRPTYRLPPRRSFLGSRPWPSAATWHSDFTLLIYLNGLIDPCDNNSRSYDT